MLHNRIKKGEELFVQGDIKGAEKCFLKILREGLNNKEAYNSLGVIEAGAARLVGTDPENIFTETVRILENQDEYQSMAKAINPFGDGKASQRIVSSIRNWPV